MVKEKVLNSYETCYMWRIGRDFQMPQRVTLHFISFPGRPASRALPILDRGQQVKHKWNVSPPGAQNNIILCLTTPQRF